MDFSLSADFLRSPAISRSYSLPNSLRTLSSAPRIAFAASGLLKSVYGSFEKSEPFIDSFLRDLASAFENLRRLLRNLAPSFVQPPPARHNILTGLQKTLAAFLSLFFQ